MIKLHRALKEQIFLLVAMLSLVQPAVACRNPLGQTDTLLNELPANAQNEPIVAVVEAIELLPPPWKKDDNWEYTSRVRARVVEAIKGVTEGQRFVVDTVGTSCDQVFPRTGSYFQTQVMNRRFFIAGQVKAIGYGDTVFSGPWQSDLHGKKSRVRD